MGNNKKPPTKRPASEDKKRSKAAKRERRHPVWRIIGYLALAGAACVTVLVGAAVGYITSMLKGLPTVTADKFTNLSEPSVVYDKNGKVIGKFAREGDRQPVTSINEVSPFLANAFIAAEDKTFYSNSGINPTAIARAGFQDVFGHKIVSGASTITQQTVKLALFPEQERTAKRKIQEIALALKVTNLLSKNEILTDYMNWVYMGKTGQNGYNVYGVKAASQVMFNKDVKDLTLPEAAFLAAIPNNASLFSPYEHPDNTVKREQYILQQMLDNNMITQAQYDAALKVDVTKEIKAPPKDSTPYPYVLRDNVEPVVAQYLVDTGKYGTVEDAENALPTAGYKIYTTIDLAAQNNIDSVLKNDKLFKGTTKVAKDEHGKTIVGKDGKPIMDLYEAGATLIDNQTGGIVAIGGGRDFANGAYVDHSDIPRKPGSSIKPLLDYGPAIDMHQITAATALPDTPIKFVGGDGKPWLPTDDDNAWEGITTMRQALVESRNVPAIRVLDLIHPSVASKYLEKMGITPDSKTLRKQDTLTVEDTNNLAAAIGGLKHGLTVQQMTSAYTVFPNQGVWRPSYIVDKVADRQGNLLYQHKAQANQVFSAQTAYIMTDVLHGVVYGKGGTAGQIGAHFPGYMIAGKTGTTDDYKDGWFVGYTQKYTMGVWMGYDYNEPINTWDHGGRDDYSLKFKLWNMMMDPILKKDPPTQPFPKPSGITSVQVCSKSGLLPTDLCKSDNDVITEMFIAGTEPTTTCTTHVSALYTIVNGKKYLATTNTPPTELHQGIFLVPPDGWTPNIKTADSNEYLPSSPDPRGGSVLQGPSTGQIQTLPAPQGMQAVADSSGKVQLAWKAVDGATGYTVWRSTSQDGPYVNIGGPITSTTFVDNTVPANTPTVYYEVYAVSSNGVSPPSNPASATFDGSPGTGGDGGTGNTTGNTATGHGNGTGHGFRRPHHGGKSGTGLPDVLWPSESQYRSLG